MLDEKEISEIRSRVTDYIRKGAVTREKEKKFVGFFLNNAKNSLDSAKLLFEVSTRPDVRASLGLPDFNGFLWVINASYYSMFYMARALLESEGIKIKTDLAIHSVVFDALVYYFYLTGKLEKKLLEDFAEAEEESLEILGKEKARKLMEDYLYEKKKRGTITYETGVIAMQNKAQTSLERAKQFSEELRKMIEL